MKSPYSHINSNRKRVELPLHREGKLPESKNPDGLCLYIPHPAPGPAPLPAEFLHLFIRPTVN